MNKRYSIVYSAGENLYITGCPIMISTAALLKDNETERVLIQVKLRNIYNNPSPVVSTTIEIMPLDEYGVQLGDKISYEYKDVSVERNEEFGNKTAVYLPDSGTRSFRIRVKNMTFADGRSGTINGEEFFEPIPPQKPLSSFIQSSDCIEQYKYENGSECDKSPMEFKDLWICSCGGINRKNEEKCVSCKSLKSSVFNNDTEILKQRLNDRRMKESANTVFEVGEEIIEDNTERELKTINNNPSHVKDKKKKKKWVVLLSSSVLFIAIVVILLVCIFIPSHKYDSAQRFLEEGDFEMAKSTFESTDYKDSKELVDQISKIMKAQKEIESKAYAGGLKTIEQLLSENEVSDSIRAKADAMVVDIVNGAIDTGSATVYRNAKSLFQNIIESYDDKNFKEKVSSFEEYNNILEIGAIDSKEKIKKAENHLSKITTKIKGVDQFREVLNEYKEYVGTYKKNGNTSNIMFGEAVVFIGVANASDDPWAAIVKVDNNADNSSSSFQFEFPKKSVGYSHDVRQDQGMLVWTTHMKGTITLKNKNTLSFDSDTYLGYDCVRTGD